MEKANCRLYRMFPNEQNKVSIKEPLAPPPTWKKGESLLYLVALCKDDSLASRGPRALPGYFELGRCLPVQAFLQQSAVILHCLRGRNVYRKCIYVGENNNRKLVFMYSTNDPFNPTPHGSVREQHPTACRAAWPNKDVDIV
jgi:hypothetical protein